MQLLFLGLTALYATYMITVSFEQQDPLTDIIEDKERIVNELAAIALTSFQSRCSHDCGDSCAHSACGSRLTTSAGCSDEFGAAVVQDPYLYCEQN